MNKIGKKVPVLSIVLLCHRSNYGIAFTVWAFIYKYRLYIRA